LKQDYIAIRQRTMACLRYNEQLEMQSQRQSTLTDLSGLYDEDFFEWTRRSAELLRAGQLEQADIEHIAEEIEDMGKRDLRGLDSRVEVLLIHLLKWQLQPAKRSRSWQTTIASQRIKVKRLLRQSPSLRRKIYAHLGGNYEDAVHLAVIETGLPLNKFPAECPFTVEQILDPEFLP
jgi:hypothetical protein